MHECQGGRHAACGCVLVMLGSRIRLVWMVRYARTVLRSCGCEPVPHNDCLQLHVQSRGGTTRPDSVSHLTVNLLVRARFHIKVDRQHEYLGPLRPACCLQGRWTQSVCKAAQRGRETTKPPCHHQLGAHHSTHCVDVTRHFEAAQPYRPPCASPGINLCFP